MNFIPKLRLSVLPYNDRSIIDVFENNQLVVGPHVDLFESGLAHVFGYQYANTTSSGFAALLLALKSLAIEKAKVVVPNVSTCQAMTNAVLATDNNVVFCEVDPEHLSLSITALDSLYQRDPFDAIIAPSHFGIPAPIEAYKKYGVPVIEDACQAFFTRSTIRSTADILVLSFYPTKQFNCIEGGAVLHNSEEKAQVIKDLRYYDHQKSFDSRTRYNLRMANLHAAFGCLLLEKIDVERIRLMVRRDEYINGINRKDLLLAAQCDEGVIPWRFLIKSSESLKMFNIQTEKEMVNLQRYISADGNHDWYEMYQSIPFFSTMNEKEQNYIIQRINEWN
jgi:dTDP-4-amino-4,6-dideoxygalactose transaminase